jgi:hypothetical protein
MNTEKERKEKERKARKEKKSTRFSWRRLSKPRTKDRKYNRRS